MGLSLLAFENRIEAFRANKSKENLNNALSAFCDAMNNKEKIRVLILKEKLQNGIEDTKVLKINVGQSVFFAFYTSELRESISPLHYETVVFPLAELVKLALAEKNLTGIVVNPSEDGKDLFIEINMIRKCFEAVQRECQYKDKPENPFKR